MITESQKEFIAKAEKLSGKKFTGTTKAEAAEYAKQFFQEVNDTYKKKGCYPTEAATVLSYCDIEKLWKQKQKAWEEYLKENRELEK
jgi:hypothetical protein